jgi:uncharacterized phage-associated protein
MKFNPITAAQMSAFFAQKEGGAIYVLKLIKLLYLADRLSLQQYGEPISWDHMVSMDHGPVLSETLNYINGFKSSNEMQQWEEWISDRAEHKVAIAKENLTRSDLNHLSKADLKILEAIWSQYGHMTRWELRDFTHKNCPEWNDPKGTSLSIDYEDVVRAMGRTPNEVGELYQKMREQQQIDKYFSKH